MIELKQLVEDFARGVKRADDRHPQAVNARTSDPYEPGIGPHTEAQTVSLVVDELAVLDPAYALNTQGVRYSVSSRQRCDWCLGSEPDWVWAIEVKLFRMRGDNGKSNDNMLMHILSPYPKHRSALTDCEKLVESSLRGRKAILILGYDDDEWSLTPAIEAFETLARCRVALGPRHAAQFDGLMHPHHQRGSVYAWEVAEKAV